MEGELDFNEWLAWLVMENLPERGWYSWLGEKHQGSSFKWIFIEQKVTFGFIFLGLVFFTKGQS